MSINESQATILANAAYLLILGRALGKLRFFGGAEAAAARVLEQALAADLAGWRQDEVNPLVLKKIQAIHALVLDTAGKVRGFHEEHADDP